VEKKNWTVVRRMVGYRRYDTDRELQLLNILYDNLRLLVNFFHPSMKLISKSRQGARVYKRYDKPKTPFLRVVEDPSVSILIKRRLRAQMRTLNPIELKRKIVDIQQRLEAIAVAKAKVKQSFTPPYRKASGKRKRR
jgi:hypothetical protein